jgi:hypothetical protein
MGKIRQLVKKVLDLIGGDAAWHVITEVKRYFLGPRGVWHVLTFIAGGVTSGYYAFQAYINSWPSYFVVPFFIGVFACVVVILNGLWSLWNKWQYPPSTVQPDTNPVLGPDDLIHPSTDGVLWRWRPEVAADGPFCPTHPRERLFLISAPGGTPSGEKWRDFEGDYLTFNYFVCPVNRSEEFKSLQQHALRVYQLRAQATARFRAMYKQQDLTTPGKKEEEIEGRLEIEQTHVEIMWGSTLNGELHPLSKEDRVPHNASFFLQVGAKITATPPRWVEEIGLELTGNRIDNSNWIPERINGQRDVYIRFGLPSSISQGNHSAQLTVKALGANRGVIEKRARSFDVVIAHSYSDLQRILGASAPPRRIPSPAVREAIRSDLKPFFTRGHQLLHLYSSPKLVDEEAWQEWVQDLNTFLRDSLDESYIDRWNNHDGLKPFSLLPVEVPGRNRKLYADISFRLQRLGEFDNELKS